MPTEPEQTERRQEQTQPAEPLSITVVSALKSTPTIFFGALVLLCLLTWPFYGNDFIAFIGKCIGKGAALALFLFGIINALCGIITCYSYWHREQHRTLWEKAVQPFIKKYAFLLVTAQLTFTMFCIAPFSQYQQKGLELGIATKQVTDLNKQIAYLKSQAPFTEYSNRLVVANARADKEHTNYLDMQNRWLNALAATNSSANVETYQGFIVEVEKMIASDTNAESYNDKLEKGRLLTKLKKQEWIEQQKEGIEMVYYLWNYSASELQTSLTEIANECSTNKFNVTTFPDLEVASEDIAAGSFSGDIGSNPSCGWTCYYNADGIPTPTLRIIWTGNKPKSAMLFLRYDGGRCEVSLTVDGIQVDDLFCSISDKKTALFNAASALKDFRDAQTHEDK